MDGTTLGQGTFTVPSTIVNQVIQIPSAADWLRVVNYTRQGTVGGASAYGFEYYWQRGMAAGTGIVTYNTNAAQTAQDDQLVTGGFTLYDPSGQSANAAPVVGPAVAISAVTNSTQPAITCTSTAGLSVGSIVRISNTAQFDVNGLDAVVSAVTDATHFTILFNAGANRNLLATAPGLVGGAGFYRIISYPLFYPRRRVVTNFGTLNGVANSVATSTAHGFTPGQVVRFAIPSLVGGAGAGSVELNSTPQNNYQVFTIQAVTSDYNFTIIPPSSVSTFYFPTSAQIAAGAQFPIVTPVGEDTASALAINAAQVPTILGNQIPNTQTGILADAEVNTGYLGMILGTLGTTPAGITNLVVSGPSGYTAGDVVYWVAGKSTYGGL